MIIRPGAIGDCLCWLPVLPFLRSEWTAVWTSTAVVPLLLGDAVEVASIASVGLDGFGLPGRDPDPVLCSRLSSFDRILSWYGAKRVPFVQALSAIGVPCQFFEALPPSDYQASATDFFAEQLGMSYGLFPRLSVHGSVQRDRIVIHPFSGSRLKNWPLSSFQELAKRLPLAVEWLAGPEEVLPGATRIERLDYLASWLSGARCYVGNDSGITHLAAAVDVPTLALFGDQSPHCWEPRAPNVQVLRAAKLDELSVSEVLRAANQLLDSL